MSQSQLNQTDFEPIEYEAAEAEKISGQSTSYWKDAWRRFRKNKLALASIIVIIFLCLMAAFVTVLSGQHYFDNDLISANKPVSGGRWFGTDNLLRDIFARTWYGARISLFIGLSAAFIDLVIGVIWGSVSGYVGGKVDEYMMRIADILTGVPYLLVVVLLTVIMPRGLWSII